MLNCVEGNTTFYATPTHAQCAAVQRKTAPIRSCFCTLERGRSEGGDQKV
ncbi:hypothetical protein JF535_13565 [Microbulbifer salipaludis]|uniref:Uncharacterized protein n=1 Tax=Microbulbifer salipaludis TaxID=187980 RepID=A0ABS3E9L1_9GAMM|nr:hypothetical protein [Microbulbifer salipaludis]